MVSLSSVYCALLTFVDTGGEVTDYESPAPPTSICSQGQRPPPLDTSMGDVLLRVVELEADRAHLHVQLEQAHATIAHLHQHVDTVKTWVDDRVGRLRDDLQTMSVKTLAVIDRMMARDDEVRGQMKKMEEEMRLVRQGPAATSIAMQAQDGNHEGGPSAIAPHLLHHFASIAMQFPSPVQPSTPAQPAIAPPPLPFAQPPPASDMLALDMVADSEDLRHAASSSNELQPPAGEHPFTFHDYLIPEHAAV